MADQLEPQGLIGGKMALGLGLAALGRQAGCYFTG
jgi:hypothetical protein